MEDVKKRIEQLSDDDLVYQFENCLQDYTPEASEYLKLEIQKRDLIKTEEPAVKATEGYIQLNEEDFIKLDHSFNKIDLELAVAMLRDEKILFFVDNPDTSIILPTEGEADQQFTLHVLKTMIEKTEKLIEEHFEKMDGRYFLKNRTVIDQLKTFSFNLLRISEMEALERIDVDFSADEKQFLIQKGMYILENADAIEAQNSRVIFYFDSIETIVDHLKDDSEPQYTKTELLTILEILQIAAEQGKFSTEMEEATQSLLNLFLDQ